jgi:DNA polymerase-3 subunit epsilon
MIRQAPRAEEVMRQLLDFIAGRPLVAHNASFDHGFLSAELDRIGESCPTGLLCSMKVARRVYPEAPNHRLETLIAHVRIEATGQYHRALADAEMTALLWLRMERKLQHDFDLPEVPLELMRRIQTAPCKTVDKFVGQLQASGLAGLTDQKDCRHPESPAQAVAPVGQPPHSASDRPARPPPRSHLTMQ